jgi:hypothetical protein
LLDELDEPLLELSVDPEGVLEPIEPVISSSFSFPLNPNRYLSLQKGRKIFDLMFFSVEEVIKNGIALVQIYIYLWNNGLLNHIFLVLLPFVWKTVNLYHPIF